MADEIINARVKQKVDTEENWLANPLILLEGEQGFVWTDDDPNQPVNFKIGDGTKTFSELPYFIAYYSSVLSHKIIRLPNVSVDQNVSGIFNSNTNLYDVVVTNVGGDDIVLKIGTTDGGSEIGEYNIGAGNTVIDIKYFDFSGPETVYLSGFTGNELSIIIIYFNYSESPAVPPESGGDPTPFRFPKGFVGMFIPVGIGHLEACFDMITGMGVAGSKYENCQICDPSNPYLDMSNAYPIGYVTGQTLGSQVGSASNTVTLITPNLPSFTVPLKYEILNQQRGNSGSRYNFVINIPTGPTTTNLPFTGSSAPIDIRPKSKYVLYFLAITEPIITT